MFLSKSRFLSLPINKIITQRCYTIYRVDEDDRMSRFMKKLIGRKSQHNLLNPKEIISSKGTPTFLTACKGNSRTIKRRQLMLNKHFMQGISDVLAYEDVGKMIIENGVTITHVSVGQHFNHLSIFWTTSSVDFKTVESKLNALIPELTKKLIEKNFMSNIPAIRFIFDRNQINNEMLENIFKEFSIKSDPKEFTPPSKDATGYHIKNPIGVKQWAKRVAKFSEQFKEEQESKYNETMEMKMNYTYTRFEYPPDMALNFAGLDYESYINRVNEKLGKLRSKASNYVADPLPPAHWVENPDAPPPEHLNVQTKSNDERLNALKEFVIANRKKKTFARKIHAREEKEFETSIAEDLKDAKARMELKDKTSLLYEDEVYEVDDEDK